MGSNWEKIYLEVEGCKDIGEVEKFLMSCNVEKSRVFSLIKKSLSGYGRDRKYREERNVSMKSLREEIKVLESKLEKSK